MYSLQALLDRDPARQHAERHQEGRQHHEQHRNAVDAEMVGDAGAEPGMLLDHLEAGIGVVEVRSRSTATGGR